MAGIHYTGDEHERQEARRRSLSRAGRIALMVWFVLVVIYFLWEMVNYRGLYALISEWEFAKLGRNIPVTNFAVLVLLFSLPSFWLLRSPQRGQLPFAGKGASVVRAQRFSGILGYAAGGLGIAALASAITALIVAPGFNPQAVDRVVDVANARVANGPAEVRGTFLFTKSAIFSLDAISTGHDTRIVPIVPAGQAGGPLRYFAEYSAEEFAEGTADVAAGSRTGVVQENRVPPPILVLYRDAGYEIASPSYLVSRSKAIVNATFWGMAFMLAIAALIAALLYFVQRRHIRRLLAEPETAEPAPEALPAG